MRNNRLGGRISSRRLDAPPPPGSPSGLRTVPNENIRWCVSIAIDPSGTGAFCTRRRGAVLTRFITNGTDRDDGRSHLDGLPLVEKQFHDNTVMGAGQFDERFGRLDLDNWLVNLDLIAGLDEPLDDIGLGQALAHVGKAEML